MNNRLMCSIYIYYNNNKYNIIDDRSKYYIKKVLVLIIVYCYDSCSPKGAVPYINQQLQCSDFALFIESGQSPLEYTSATKVIKLADLLL